MKYFKFILLLLVLICSITAYSQPGTSSQDLTDTRETLGGMGEAIEGEAAETESAEGVVEIVGVTLDDLQPISGAISEISAVLAEMRREIGELREAQRVANAADEAIDAIPGADAVSAGMEPVIGVLGTLIQAAEDVVDPVQDTVAEGKSFLEKVKIAGEVILTLNVIYEVVKEIPHWIKEIEKKIEDSTSQSNTSSDIDYKCVNGKLKQFSRDFIPLLKASNSTLKNLKAPTKELNDLLKSIKPVVSDLENVTKPIKKFMDDMDPLKKELQKFEKALNKKISFKFKVQILMVNKTFHIHIISVKDAMRGVSHIEKVMKDELSGEVVEALKLFGMEKAAKEIKKLAEDPFKDATKLLIKELDKVNIPGVKDFLHTLNKTETLFNGIVTNAKTIIHNGIPDFNTNEYKDIKSQGMKYYESKCAE
ncbi:MAG: hypothetical protein JXR69_07970 [Candidatus Delongbacteria bacterium]|nr:hypothetical protein [Candidatus Delongbacteria bacterium]